MNVKLGMSWHCMPAAHKAICILGCILIQKCGQQVKGGDSLLYSAPMSRIEDLESFWSSGT